MKRLTIFLVGMILTGLLACGGGVIEGDGFIDEDVNPGMIDLQAILEQEADPNGPAVTVFVKTPQGEASAATGLFDTSSGRGAAPDDVFRIGSVSKMFTAAATLDLVDSGQLSLDDTAADYLNPALISNISNAEEATVRQLLNHTAGVPDYLDDFFVQDSMATNRTWQAADTLSYAEGYDAPFAPGNGYEYSNTNYILLHLIVEAASGQGLHTNIRQSVITPLGLSSTYTQVFESGTAPVHGYEDMNNDGANEDVTTLNDGAGLGDGGLISNGRDVARFLEALVINGEILREGSREAMLRSYRDNYGLGIELESSPWGPQIGHSGGVSGYESLAYTFPDYGTTVVVLTGTIDDYDLSGIIDEVMNELYP